MGEQSTQERAREGGRRADDQRPPTTNVDVDVQNQPGTGSGDESDQPEGDQGDPGDETDA